MLLICIVLYQRCLLRLNVYERARSSFRFQRRRFIASHRFRTATSNICNLFRHVIDTYRVPLCCVTLCYINVSTLKERSLGFAVVCLRSAEERVKNLFNSLWTEQLYSWAGAWVLNTFNRAYSNEEWSKCLSTQKCEMIMLTSNFFNICRNCAYIKSKTL